MTATAAVATVKPGVVLRLWAHCCPTTDESERLRLKRLPYSLHLSLDRLVKASATLP
jgi:hypothetical protein